MTQSSLSESELEQILASMATALANPSDDIPSTRCVTGPTLTRTIAQAVTDASLTAGRAPSARRVVEMLTRARLLKVVPVDPTPDRKPRTTLYAVGMSTDPDELAPVQLLQAIAPDGIICYMSALQVHALLDHDVAHHHIARLDMAPSRQSSNTHARTGRNTAFGSWQCTIRGTPYYLTRRYPRYLVAHQRRQVDADTWFRVTTLEQTLVDTLHRPDHCGGPTVVLAAWENAATTIDSDALTSVAEKIADPWITRRIGYMLARVGHSTTAIADLLDAAPVSANAEPLFPGVPYTRVDRDWQLLVP